jgi:hypothetical protein
MVGGMTKDWEKGRSLEGFKEDPAMRHRLNDATYISQNNSPCGTRIIGSRRYVKKGMKEIYVSEDLPAGFLGLELIRCIHSTCLVT